MTLLARADQGDEERRRVAKEAPEKIREALNFIRNQLFEVNCSMPLVITA